MSTIENGFDSLTNDQRLVKLAAQADRDETVAAIREGLSDIEAGRVQPARSALRALARRYRINLALDVS